MSNGERVDGVAVEGLNDQHWRRLGITQTFERLLVETVATEAGEFGEVGERAGRNLSGGAARFWEMSFPQMLKELCRRKVLQRDGDAVSLNDEFADRLQRLLDAEATGASHVAPTPGVTLDDIIRQADARKVRETAEKAAARKRTTRSATAARAKSAAAGEATPKKRSAGDDKPKSAAARSKAAQPPRTSAEKLFTSIRLNRLLDALDTGSMSIEQLGSRLSLSEVDTQFFFRVSDSIGLTRTNERLVELHWKGRELARTSDADRRMALREAVKELRNSADDVFEATTTD